MIPSEPHAFWQYFDVIVIGGVSSVVFWLLMTHKGRTNALLPSISQTVAAEKRSSLIFSLMMTVCVPLYYAWLWFWVGPYASAPWYFYTLLIVSIVAEMIFVWVPATSGRSKRIHELTAWFVGVVMLAAPLILLFAGQISASAQVGVVTYVVGSGILATMLCSPRLRKHTLWIEVVYCAMFWAVMSLIAHT